MDVDGDGKEEGMILMYNTNGDSENNANTKYRQTYKVSKYAFYKSYAKQSESTYLHVPKGLITNYIFVIGNNNE